MTRIVKNPTPQEVENAMTIVNKTEPSACVTDRRYAMSEYGSLVDGNVAVGGGLVDLVCYVTVYSPELATTQYIPYHGDHAFPVYSPETIKKAKLVPVTAEDLPKHFPVYRYIIHYEGE